MAKRASCPKCGSPDLHAERTRAAWQPPTTGALGLAFSGTSRTQLEVTCLAYGHEFRRGKSNRTGFIFWLILMGFALWGLASMN